jgi:two-component system, sensor histidine kinase
VLHQSLYVLRIRQFSQRAGRQLHSLSTLAALWAGAIAERATLVKGLRINDVNPAIERATDSDRLENVKDAYWQLAENEVRFRELVDAQDELIVRRDDDARILFANRAYCEAFCVTLTDIQGRRFSPAIVAVEVQPGFRALHSSVAERIETSKGLRWIQWEEQRLISTAGKREVQCVGRDVTDERRAAAELCEARDQAQSANRAKSRFLAAMSHEIRTPMNGILGMAGLLGQTPQSEEQRCYTRAIDQSARALLALIDEILDFSKIEAGKLKLAPEAFSLRECVASAIELLEHKAADKGISLSYLVAHDVPDVLMGDHSRIRQIVLNLVSNAVKFTDHGGVDVLVRGSTVHSDVNDGTLYDIVVKDTGIGFSAETLKRLFDEFEQAEGNGGHRQNGTGLGLAISQRLARAMGGDITAEGSPGRGATFVATVRLATVTSQSRTDYRSGAALRMPTQKDANFIIPPTIQAPRILIAEDNEINALLTRRVSERAGCKVVVVKNGRCAVEAVEQMLRSGENRFDIILMDVFMPDMDGLEATAQIKRLFARCTKVTDVCPPIVALTANAFAEDRDRCIAAGMDDYLAKPFDAGQLISLLARWVPRLDRRRSGQRGRSSA